MKSTIDHRTSNLLTREENDQVFRLFGARCQALATAVVQLYLTHPPDHSQWIKRDTGVMCLIKDNTRRNYFFRFYCINRKMMIWEQEVYNNFDYKNPCPYLHTFEADDCVAAFNFASEDEAYFMRTMLLEKLEQKRMKREERRQRNSVQQYGSVPTKKINSNSQNVTNTNNGTYPFAQQSKTLPAPHSNKPKKRRNLTKADIGNPQDFVHISHVGWNPHTGFDINNLGEQPELKEFFHKAGVSESQLQDKDTRDFIYDFIYKHGGIDAVKEYVEDVPRRAPVPSLVNAAPTPPPVPARTPHSRTAPPPPPPNKTQRPVGGPRTLPPKPEVVTSSVPEPPPLSSAPLPPPMPPPMEGLASPPPPPPPMSQPPMLSSQGADPRSALLESIRTGRTLKHVEVERKTSVSDSRGDLLNEIRQGVELKPVENAPRPSSNSSEIKPGLAGALARALAERSRAIHSESDSDSEESSEDDDWDD